MPRLQAALPPGIDVSVLIDRTGPIRASIEDVKFTMMITIALVVGVIFLFLRDIWATLIPGVTVPMSIVGTLAVMYALGYSIDNLSLMGLTIAVGFVVDDAIVMLENIYRHIEDGMDRFAGRAQRRGRDRLHHRLDQRFADRRVHPDPVHVRHRRPAVARVRRRGDDDDRDVGLRLADADADDVLALSLRPEARRARLVVS